MKYSRISRAESFPVSRSKHSQSRSASNPTSRTGNSTRLPSFTSRLRALAISVFTHSLLMLCSERINSSLSCRRMASSICSWILRPPLMSCGEPAAHALGLQVGIQSICKLLVFGRVADEAGVELDGPSHHRADVGNELVGNAAARQECVGNLAVGLVDGVNADGGGADVSDGFESL